MPGVIGVLFALSASPTSFGWLETPLFSPPLADVHASELLIGWHLDDPRYFDGKVGARLGLLRYSPYEEVDLQLGIEGSVWTRLRVQADEVFALRTADYLIGLPLMARWREMEAVIELTHISAHLGDGFAYQGSELSTELQRPPINYSREWIALRIGWRHHFGPWTSRVYGGGGGLVRVRPLGTARGFAMLGGELVLNVWDTIAPYAAAEVTYNQDTQSVDFSMEVGAFVGAWQEPQTLRLALVGYVGSDRRGQAMGRRAEYLSLALIVRL